MPDTALSPASIGHNSAAVGEMIAENPALVFDQPDMLDQLVSELEAQIAERDIDLESTSGRTAIRSFAYAIAQTKTAIDKAGADLNTEHNEAIRKVNTVRKSARDQLDALKDKARAPLTEWEQREEDRKAKVEDFFDLLKVVPGAGSVDACEEHLEWLDGLTVDETIFLDRTAEAVAEIARYRDLVQQALEAARKVEAERAELDQLRKEKEEREARERAEAEAKAAAEAEELRKAEEAERIRQAKARAAQEAEEKARAEAAAEQRRKDEEAAAALAAERAAKEKAEAELAAKRAAERREAEEAAAREADRQHREKVQAEAAAAIAAHGMVSDAAAEAIVTAILAGEVPHVSLKF